MKSLKILLLSSIFVFTNCSIINDKIFSPRSEKNQNDKSDEKEIVKERIYIEDDKKKEKVQIQEGLQGDTDFEDNNEYPNLADVPTRPEPSISLEEQNRIVKKLENNSQLDSLPSELVEEDKISNLEPTFNRSQIDISKKKNIEEIYRLKLREMEDFKPDTSYSKKELIEDEQYKELHALSRSLKNIETSEQIKNVEENIKKNYTLYNPSDIETILGLRGLDSKKEIIAKKRNTSEKQNISDTNIVKKIQEREVPVAKITFNHGSTQLTHEDISRIKEVANLFYENQGKKIVIVGHASSRTNYDMDLTKHAIVNFNISLERARKVMSGFSTIGLNSQKIELVAMSDANPIYSEIMPSLEAANRRAEIFIEY